MSREYTDNVMMDFDEIMRRLTEIRDEQQSQRKFIEEMHAYTKSARNMGRFRLAILSLVLLFSFGSVYLYYRTIVNMFSF